MLTQRIEAIALEMDKGEAADYGQVENKEREQSVLIKLQTASVIISLMDRLQRQAQTLNIMKAKEQILQYLNLNPPKLNMS